VEKDKLIILSGCSGAGKTTIYDEVRKKNVSISRVVTYTTRNKREGETDGKDYWFVSREQFLKMRSNAELLESSEVYGKFYGSKKEDVERLLNDGKTIMMIVDVLGALALKKLMPQAVLVFVRVADGDELERRLMERGKDSEEEIRKRRKISEEELGYIDQFDVVVDNEDLEEAVAKVIEVIDC